MKPKITLTWDGEKCVPKYSNEFVEADRIVRMDMLMDAICDLTNLYNDSFKLNSPLPKEKENDLHQDT
jgi:hypothetical protein